MTAALARKRMRAILDRHGVTATIKARVVSFDDLARDAAVFVRLSDISGLGDKWQILRAEASLAGFILSDH